MENIDHTTIKHLKTQRRLHKIRVLVVIVNFQTAKMVVNCLHSLVGERRELPHMRVVVTDNHSEDGSIALLTDTVNKQRWQCWVTILPLERNGGFSYGNNAAIKTALKSNDPPELILMLNPDTIIHAGAVTRLAAFMLEHPEVGVAGSAMVDGDDTPQPSARRFPSPFSELDSGARFGVISRLLSNCIVTIPIQNEAHTCDWVSGASMMVRRNVFDKIGLLDEEYFLYFEELDFCHRAKKAGYSVWHVPQARITHLEGAATGVNQRRRRGRYWYDSRRRYFVKAYGVLGLLYADMLWATGRLSLKIRYWLRLGKNFDSIKRDPINFAWDLLMGDFLAIITGRVFSIRG